MLTDHYPNTRFPLIGPVFVAAFAAAAATLVAWFATHVPFVHAPEPLARLVILVCWLGALVVVLRIARPAPRPAMVLGIAAGLLSAAIGALLLAGTRASGNFTLVAVAFLAVGIVLGAAAGAQSAATYSPVPSLSNRPQPWAARFALVTALTVAPLLFIGGLVTSADAGMAVPDWPTTFGANMLEFPLDAKTPQDIFLEHSHRLFGMLVGLATFALLVWVLLARRGGWPRMVAIAAFLLVCVQGVIGGIRVRSDSRPLAMFHGVLAQLVFALIVSLAAYLSPSFSAPPSAREIDPVRARRLKAFATALLHTLVLQLLLGAVGRHFRKSTHAVWTHAALSVVVVILATAVGFAAASLPRTAFGGVAALRRFGIALIALVNFQFLLGVAAFLIRGPQIKAESTFEALIRTAHQANGGLLIATAACAFVWSRWLWRGVRPATPVRPPANSAIPAQPTAAAA